MQNLTEQEQVEWKAKCDRQRRLARTSPCFHPGQALMECYKFSLGPFNFVLTLDRYLAPPQWSGSVSLFREISEDRVTDEQGWYIFDAPHIAMVDVHSWTHEEYSIARDLLGDVFGELIHDEHQRMVETKGRMTLQWTTLEREAGTLDS